MKLNASVQTGRTNPESCNRSLENINATVVSGFGPRLMMVMVGALLASTMVSCQDFNDYQRWVSNREAERNGRYGAYKSQYPPGYLAERQRVQQPSYQRPPVSTKKTAPRVVTQKSKTVKKMPELYYSCHDTRKTKAYPRGLYWAVDRNRRTFYFNRSGYERFKQGVQLKGGRVIELVPFQGTMPGVPPSK